MIDEFENNVIDAKNRYRIEKRNTPKYIILNEKTFELIKKRVSRRALFGLVDKKTYKGLYIAIDNELERFDFIITG